MQKSVLSSSSACVKRQAKIDSITWSSASELNCKARGYRGACFGE